VFRSSWRRYYARAATFRVNRDFLVGLWGAAGTSGLGLGGRPGVPGAAPNQALQRTSQLGRFAPQLCCPLSLNVRRMKDSQSLRSVSESRRVSETYVSLAKRRCCSRASACRGFCLFRSLKRRYHAGAAAFRVNRETWLGSGAPPGLPGSAWGAVRESWAQRLTRRCSGPASWRVPRQAVPSAELER